MKENNETLSAIGKSKRKNLKKIAATTAFAVPVITSFHVGDMITNEANAYNGSINTGGSGGEDRLT